MRKPMDRSQPDPYQKLIKADIDKPWGHQPGEPQAWYTRFHHFLMEGPTRSISKAVKSYAEVYDDEPMHYVNWCKMRSKWSWYKRAYAYDRAQQGKEEDAVLQHRIIERKRRYEVLTRLADLIDLGLDQIEERIHDDENPLELSVAQMNRAIATYLSHSRDEFEPSRSAAIKIEDNRKVEFTIVEVERDYGQIINGTADLIDG